MRFPARPKRTIPYCYSKPAKCKNTPNQCAGKDQLHNHPNPCFGLIHEGSRSDGADCRTAENDPLNVRQIDWAAADNCGIGRHKKSDAKQIEQDTEPIPFLHSLLPPVQSFFCLFRRQPPQGVPEIDLGVELSMLKNDGTGFLTLNFTEVSRHDDRNRTAGSAAL